MQPQPEHIMLQLTARPSGAAAGKQYLVNPLCEYNAPKKNLMAKAQRGGGGGAGFRTGRSPAFGLPVAVFLPPVRILLIQRLATSHFRLGHCCQSCPGIGRCAGYRTMSRLENVEVVRVSRKAEATMENRRMTRLLYCTQYGSVGRCGP